MNYTIREILNNKIFIAFTVLFLSLTGFKDLYINALFIPYLSTRYEIDDYQIYKDKNTLIAHGKYVYDENVYYYNIEVDKKFLTKDVNLIFYAKENKYYEYTGVLKVVSGVIKILILIILFRLNEADRNISFIMLVFTVTGFLLALILCLI